MDDNQKSKPVVQHHVNATKKKEQGFVKEDDKGEFDKLEIARH